MERFSAPRIEMRSEIWMFDMPIFKRVRRVDLMESVDQGEAYVRKNRPPTAAPSNLESNGHENVIVGIFDDRGRQDA